MTKMNRKERADVIRAMELIARTCNDEDVFEGWLIFGVADGDIDETTTDDEILDWYGQDERFADLMDTFLRVMSQARKSGGLYCDRIVSKASE